MGYSFTYPIFKLLGGSKVVAYVHYPTISTDMLTLVSEQRFSYNNNSNISKSKLKSIAKLIYYHLFARLYGFMGSFSDLAMVNSTWTKNHIVSIWKIPRKIEVLFPPCNVGKYKSLPLQPRKQFIVSLAQFRPEKDHALQLRSFSKFLDKYPSYKQKVKLLLIGASRNKEDESRIESLEKLSIQLEIADEIEFCKNVSFSQLSTLLSNGMIGIHTMWNEHFGIGIVELMSAGVIMIGHDSGGPKSDIIENGVTGFRASTEDEYADCLNKILKMKESERIEMQKKARESVERFSDENFTTRCQYLFNQIL